MYSFTLVCKFLFLHLIAQICNSMHEHTCILLVRSCPYYTYYTFLALGNGKHHNVFIYDRNHEEQTDSMATSLKQQIIETLSVDGKTVLLTARAWVPHYESLGTSLREPGYLTTRAWVPYPLLRMCTHEMKMLNTGVLDFSIKHSSPVCVKSSNTIPCW